jgi:RNA polymerase sigma factor (TIGR02999 family)
MTQESGQFPAGASPNSGSDPDRLVPLVYDELRRIAHRYLRLERPDHTLTTTALVHEAYLRMSGTVAKDHERQEFLAIAATAMRHILVDYARTRRAQKRGGELRQVELTEAMAVVSESSEMIVALDEALARLAEVEPRLVRVVECRFFGGLTEEETAEALGTSPRTVRRDLVRAKGWLAADLQGKD